MRTIKIHTVTPLDKTDKVKTFKEVADTSVVNGVLEIYGKRKDATGYEVRTIIAAFAKDYWTYFEEG